MEAISHAGTCLGISAADGILLAAECRNTNRLLDDSIISEKIYKLNDDIVCSVAGITSDANVLTNELRVIAQRYQFNYGEPMPVEQLVSYLCDIKQAYTQYGGKRPFGVSILYMGWDKVTATSYTSRTLVVIMEAGKPLVLAIILVQPFPC